MAHDPPAPITGPVPRILGPRTYGEPMPSPSEPAPVVCDVVIPCRDEAPALPPLLARLPAGFAAVVVDNGSRDGTADVAREHGARVVEEPVPGYGAAVHAGVQGVINQYALVRLGYTWDGNAIPDSTVRRENQDGVKNFLSAGLGIHVWRLYLDAAPGTAAAEAQMTEVRLWITDLHNADRASADTHFSGSVQE